MLIYLCVYLLQVQYCTDVQTFIIITSLRKNIYFQTLAKKQWLSVSINQRTLPLLCCTLHIYCTTTAGRPVNSTVLYITLHYYITSRYSIFHFYVSLPVPVHLAKKEHLFKHTKNQWLSVSINQSTVLYHYKLYLSKGTVL